MAKKKAVSKRPTRRPPAQKRIPALPAAGDASPSAVVDLLHAIHFELATLNDGVAMLLDKSDAELLDRISECSATMGDVLEAIKDRK